MSKPKSSAVNMADIMRLWKKIEKHQRRFIPIDEWVNSKGTWAAKLEKRLNK